MCILKVNQLCLKITKNTTEETKNFICIIHDVQICKIEVTPIDTFFTGVPDPSDSRHSASLPHHHANAAALMAPQGSSNETGNYANTLNEHSSIGKIQLSNHHIA